MNREQKTELVEHYNGLFSSYSSEGTIILAEYAGIDVASFKVLRNELTKNGGRMVVVKNRLAKIALAESGCEFLSEYFTGPISMAYSKDPVSLTKSLVRFAKKNEALKLKFGVMDGASLDTAKINALSQLPSLDELRAKLLSLIMASPRNIAGILNNLPSSVVRVLKARSEQN